MSILPTLLRAPPSVQGLHREILFVEALSLYGMCIDSRDQALTTLYLSYRQYKLGAWKKGGFIWKMHRKKAS